MECSMDGGPVRAEVHVGDEPSNRRSHDDMHDDGTDLVSKVVWALGRHAVYARGMRSL